MNHALRLTMLISCFALTTALWAQDPEPAFEFTVDGGAGWGYESNLRIDEIDFNAENGEQFSNIDLGGELTLWLAEKTQVDFGVSYRAKQYEKSSELDNATQMTTFGLRHEFSQITLAIQHRVADSNLDGADFLELDISTISVSGFAAREHFLRGAYNYVDKTVINNSGRDATSDEVALSYYYFASGLRDFWMFGTKLKNEDAVDPTFNYSSYAFKAAKEYRFQWLGFPHQVRVELHYRNKDFADILNPLLDDFRRDRRTRLSLGWDIELRDEISFGLELQHINNRSNLPSLTFTENTVLASFRLNF